MIVTHQLGASLRLAVLVMVFASPTALPDGAMDLAHRTGATLEVSALLVFLALLVPTSYLRSRNATGTDTNRASAGNTSTQGDR